ncbi:hypothetical protein ElyMa_000615700 [Elysia marginata]|uniref:Uncharacterized protein n=1 Tax=Elysia marginata TaxID=1093978 RepID=A0AAV4G9J5_9GAST|nr:hypothetical protein ElyMa_000615700 [Elysia marginata]
MPSEGLNPEPLGSTANHLTPSKAQNPTLDRGRLAVSDFSWTKLIAEEIQDGWRDTGQLHDTGSASGHGACAVSCDVKLTVSCLPA